MLDSIIAYFESITPLQGALYGGLFTWFATAMGAALVFFFKKMNQTLFDGLLGFTGGVMIAASYFSLLAPALEMTGGEGWAKVEPVVIGFSLGALFLFGLDKLLPHLHLNFKEAEGMQTKWKRTTLLTMAITLHNIPEGLAVGVLFGGVAAGVPEATIAGAVILTLGIAIQDFPEGFAVAVPLRRMGLSRSKSFLYGQASAIVEPIFAVLGAFAVAFFNPILPYALAFSAAAMIYVVIEEVVPETQQDGHSDVATLGFIIGFLVMMSLDVMFG